jgi:MFS transporter, OFA family, oxalate/formate antiporter
MDAQRVPPSAVSTSQSSVIVISPIALRSVTARKDRPIRRWISCVRPDCLPRAASRSPRVWVARGSMPYSAVTQPWPELRRKGGTLPSTLAVQSTSVTPKRIRQEPSAWRATPGSRMTGRSASGARPEGRMGWGYSQMGGMVARVWPAGAGRVRKRPRTEPAPHPPVTERARIAQALAAVVALNLPLGTVYAFSVFLRAFESELGLSRAALSFVFGLTLICFTIGMNAGPLLYRAAPATVLVGVAGTVAACGMAVAALAGGLVQLALGYGVLFGLGGGVAYLLLLQGMNVMLTSHRGLVNGFIVSLYPLGAMIGAPLLGLALAGTGLQATLLGLAATLALATAASALLVATSGMRMAPPEAGPATPPPPRRWGIFARLWGIFFLAAAAGLTVLSQAAGMVEAYGGTPALALSATTVIAACIAAARIGGGWLADRFPAPRVMAVAHLLAFAGNGLLFAFPSPLLAVATLVMVGVGYGFVSGSTAAAIGDYWGPNHYGRIAGPLYVAWCLAAVTLPVLAGRLFDISGGYAGSVAIAGIGNLLGVLIALGLPRRDAPG